MSDEELLRREFRLNIFFVFHMTLSKWRKRRGRRRIRTRRMWVCKIQLDD